MSEEWRPVVGFEDSYEVSSTGRIRSLERSEYVRGRWGGTVVRRYAARELNPASGSRGHLNVALRREGVGTPKGVHVLVAEAFHGPRNGRFALHKNDVPDDNRVENIYWGTPRQNNLDAVRNGRNHHALKRCCPYSHPFEGKNLVMEKGGTARRCRACKQTHLHFYRKRIEPTKVAFQTEADRRYAIIMAG